MAERLAEAADVLDRLPEPKVRGFYSLLPLLPDAAQAMAHARDRRHRHPRRSTGWTRRSAGCCWLEPEERRLVWLRAEGLPWKRITQRLGIGRTTAWQRWTMALLKIASRLNAAAEQKRPNIKPLNRSGEFVLERG